MTGNYLLSSLFAILACFLTSTVAREAIVGGSIVYGDLYPYQVSVQFHDHGHVCGGGIIGDKFVLTAAHCLLNYTLQLLSSHISVLGGTGSLHVTGPPAVIVGVEKVFFPREFYPDLHFNVGDIAILKLAESLQLGRHPYLEKLELPRHYDHRRGDSFVGFGWNEYRDGIGHSDGRLRLARIRVFFNDECESAFPEGAIQSDKHFCAKTQRVNLPQNARQPNGVCTGDGGGALVENGRTIIGILSKIPSDCNERNEPAVFTRVAHYLEMIISVMIHDHSPSMTSLHV